MPRHKSADLFLRGWQTFARAILDLEKKGPVVHGELPEPGFTHPMSVAKRVDFADKVIHRGYHMLDSSYSQCRMRGDYEKSWRHPTSRNMDNDSVIEGIKRNIQAILEEKDVPPSRLSRILTGGKSGTLISDLMTKNADAKISTLVRIANQLDVNLEQIISTPKVPIVGYIGAGGQVIYEDVGEEIDTQQKVLRPPGVSGKLVALMVQGDSMLPKYKDGDIIYIQRTHDGVLPEYVGDDCAVRLSTGETYIKQLAYGSRPGLFTLRSLNAADMVDVEVEWATPVVFIMPARSRHLY